ncbi:MAG: adenine-specific DNA-methyltransferase [Zhongshania aliphaticivorans]|jgi:adenine-specific DNA-methyltransferase
MTSPNTEMDGSSLSISEQRKNELKQLFPGVFTETLNEAGEVQSSLDFERLKAELGEFSEIYDNRRERYGMDWPGKRDSLRLIQEPSRATLKPCREESVDFDTTENLFIEGDNLEVLKLLQKSYYGQVKMIYIDPPYNTGKEFIYPDNFSESLDTYLQYAGLKDSAGRTFSTNTANEGRFHTKWLNMMFPRLYLARNLLREDGVIFISIDDNEVENLRRMCDEIFGEENFVATVIWQKAYSPRNNAPFFSESHDYILCYARAIDNVTIKRLESSEEQRKRYTNRDGDLRGDWKAGDMTVSLVSGQRGRTYQETGKGANLYEVVSPSGKKFKPSGGRCWVYGEDKFLQLDSENRIWWGEHGENLPSFKRFWNEIEGGQVCQTIWSYRDVGHNQSASKELKALFEDYFSPVFPTPKPISLVERMLELVCDDGDLFLDFFSGSATSAIASQYFNVKKDVNVSYIQIQLPEAIEKSSEVFQAGLRTIADVSKERIRRAGKKIRTELEAKLDFDDHQNLDLGFKVLKLDKSNFKQWQAPSKDVSEQELIQQMELNVDHVDPNASQEDLLYELLLKAGLMPTERLEIIALAGHSLFKVGDDSLYIYLGKNVDQALIDAVLQAKPEQFICLDKAFHGNDQLKANAVKNFAHFNQGKLGFDRIEFKTV